MELRGRGVVVAGLAATGEAAALFCLARGARVTVSDQRPAAELEGRAERVAAAGAALDLGGHTVAAFTSADLVVASPGVPWSAPPLRAAREAGVAVMAEIELASRFCRGPILAVTGTNGKSTTTALLAGLLRADGRRAQAGGNLGRPLVQMLEDDGPDVHHVVECSSFQLEGTSTFRPRVAVLTNLTADHLDRHGSLAEYAAAKARVFACQDPDDFAVVNGDDPRALSAATSARSRRADFSRTRPAEGGVWVRGEEVVSGVDGALRAVLATREIPIPGPHNLENVLAATAAALCIGADPARVREGVLGYRALDHRLQRVGEARGVTFYNDSKATNLDATLKAVASFPTGVHILLGGRDKGADWTLLREPLRGCARAAYLIGEAAPAIRAALSGAVPLRTCGSLEEAVGAAFDAAREGEIVLLAPGCASFDMFRNYEDRGRRFVEAVRAVTAGGRGAP